LATLTYLDHAATTPMRAEAVQAMLPFLTERFANPSGSHRFARSIRQVIDEARDVVADVVGCDPGEIVFTGCGTESDNTAIVGAQRRHGGVAVCSASEHHAVLNAVEHGGGLVVPTDRAGRIDLALLGETLSQTAVAERVAIVSAMAVNNEVGSITSLADVAQVVRQYAPHALVHTDAVQAPCWLDLRTISPHVHLLALSAHKFGGPKGVGVLMVRRGTIVEPLLQGGGRCG
jgi:cysteine desulfurase